MLDSPEKWRYLTLLKLLTMRLWERRKLLFMLLKWGICTQKARLNQDCQNIMQIPPIGCRSTGNALLKSLRKLKMPTRWHRFIILPNVQERQGGALHFAANQNMISDFLHIMLDGVCFSIQTLNEAYNNNEQDKERKEIAELLSSIDDTWILDQIKQCAINMTKEGGK